MILRSIGILKKWREDGFLQKLLYLFTRQTLIVKGSASSFEYRCLLTLSGVLTRRHRRRRRSFVVEDGALGLVDIPSQFYDRCTFIMIYYTSLMSRDFYFKTYIVMNRGVITIKDEHSCWSRWAFLRENPVMIFIVRSYTFIGQSSRINNNRGLFIILLVRLKWDTLVVNWVGGHISPKGNPIFRNLQIILIKRSLFMFTEIYYSPKWERGSQYYAPA